jgi:hypothetical protein
MSGEAAASARPVTAALGFADSMRTSISGNFETEDAYANSGSCTSKLTDCSYVRATLRGANKREARIRVLKTAF